MTRERHVIFCDYEYSKEIRHTVSTEEVTWLRIYVVCFSDLKILNIILRYDQVLIFKSEEELQLAAFSKRMLQKYETKFSVA